MEAVSLAGVIVQFTHVGLEFFSRFFALCRSANGTLEDMSDREAQVQVLLTDIAALEAVLAHSQGADNNNQQQQHIESCRRVLDQLSQMVDSTKGRTGKRHVVTNVKAAARAFRNKQRFEQLDQQVHRSIQGLLLRADIQHAEDGQLVHKQLEELTSMFKKALEAPSSQKPKDLGYPWEAGAPQNHIQLWSWDGTTKLDSDTWSIHATSGKGIKLSFVMSTMFGFDQCRMRAMWRTAGGECLPPKFYYMFEFRWVEPHDILYETDDIAMIPFNGDNVPQSQPSSVSSQAQQTRHHGRREGPTLSIEKVCRRLTMKWEPVLNYTHRYLYCRCILRKTTPSSLCPEMTLFIAAVCPRHNNQGLKHADYGDKSYHLDPYFDQFGGYNAFRGMVFLLFPGLRRYLGEDAFIADNDLEGVMDEAISAIDRLELHDAMQEYKYEVLKEAERQGFPLPSHALDILRERRDVMPKNEFGDLELSEDQVKDFFECPMMREVTEILSGRWSGKPHWKISD
ncbi:hypothetical protein BJX64DRAFT_284823 [Aspergillus heterothallicus]